MLKEDATELAAKLGLPPDAHWTHVVSRRDKSIWRVDGENGSFAARIFRPGEEQGASDERRMMTEARERSIPVPAVHAQTVLGDRPALLVDWCPGRVLGDALYSRPWTAVRLGKLFGEQQARLHLSRVEATKGADWIDFFKLTDVTLRDRLHAVQDRHALVHFDYHPWNVVFADGRITGIIDWTNARFGDPRADLARTWTILRLVYRSSRRHSVRRAAEQLFEKGWRLGYEAIAGRQPDMPLFLAWAVFGLLCVKAAGTTEPENSKELRRLAERSVRLRAAAGLPPMRPEALLERACAVAEEG